MSDIIWPKLKRPLVIVACKKCGWQHFEVSRQYAENYVRANEQYAKTLTKKELLEMRWDDNWEFKKGIRLYEHCGLCGGSYKNFKDGIDEEKSGKNGITISPIIQKGE